MRSGGLMSVHDFVNQLEGLQQMNETLMVMELLVRLVGRCVEVLRIGQELIIDRFKLVTEWIYL